MIHAETRRRGGVSFAVPSPAPAANHVPAASDFTVSLTRDGSKNTPSLSASPRLCANQFFFAPSRYSLFVLFAVLSPQHNAMIPAALLLVLSHLRRRFADRTAVPAGHDPQRKDKPRGRN